MKLIISLMVALVAIYSCKEQVPASKVPAVVQNSVMARFPDATGIDWKKNGSVYEAEFDRNKIEYNVHVDSSGKLLLYKYDIKATELPPVITAKISSDYDGYKIDDAEMIEKDTMIYYQAELEVKGKKELKLVFLRDGSLAKEINYLN